MSEGERMVWAATYARVRAEWMDRGLPDHVSIHNDEARAAWESDCAGQAIEHAYAAVIALRKALPETLEGWGEDSDVYRMAAEMAGKR